MENNGLYKIEELKSVGFFRRRHEWVQETKTQLSKSCQHVIISLIYYNNRAEALQRLEELHLKEIRQSDQWKEVKEVKYHTVEQ
jgi:hypothetical protein